MNLSELVAKAPGFRENWSQTERIKFFGWYLHVYRKKSRFSTADLRSCYDELHLEDPGSFSPWFKTLERKPKAMLRDGNGYYLSGSVIEDFTKRYGAPTPGVPVPSSLSALLQRISDPAERSFLEEAIKCIQAQAPRAAIVLGWCAVIDRMRRKIQALGFATFNAASLSQKNATTGKYKWWNKAVQANSMIDLQAVFDSDLIIVLVGMGLIDPNEARRLDTMFHWRCDSAHPSAAPIGPSHVVTFFTDAVDLVLDNPKFAV